MLFDTFNLFPERKIDIDFDPEITKNKFKNFWKGFKLKKKKNPKKVENFMNINQNIDGNGNFGYTITFSDRKDVVTIYTVKHDPYKDCWNCGAIAKSDVKRFEEMRKLIELDYKERNKL